MGWQDILDEREVLAAKLTVAGLSVSEIAEKCEVREETVRGWHRRPAWQSARDHLAAEADARLRSDTRAGAMESIEHLRTVIADEGEKSSIRLRAANIILMHERSYHSQQLELSSKRGDLESEAEGVRKEDLVSAAEKLRQRLGLGQPGQARDEE
jgi:hypothetical protein